MVQAVELQLGFAIDNVKASLAVKRRLACEQVEVWDQVGDDGQYFHALHHQCFGIWSCIWSKFILSRFHLFGQILVMDLQ